MLSKFDYYKPKSIKEALDYLDNNDETRILAGGTDLMILLRRNAITCKHILDIKAIPEIQRFDYKNGEGLYIGAGVNVNQIVDSEIIEEKYPALHQAAASLASYQLRNRATLVGNICNASPGGDLPPVLLVYDAEVHIIGPEGEKMVNIKDFFLGVKKTILKDNEIVLGVLLPDVEEGDNSVYLKQSRLKGHDLATVGVAARRNNENKISLAIAAVAPIPLKLTELEDVINEKGLSNDLPDWVEGEIKKYISPISDVRSSKEYRIHISGVLAKRALQTLIEKEVN
ncbi:MAG TPA: xanthine dehydrogenase family protein subunit M [Eubacteriaceae bacterium]|jgi:CO/xanthine dehydrogenase FAD-binding subunit|nr:xanthine dehydrogenase family protein subunit M [Eubacteriaceae bacterium]